MGIQKDGIEAEQWLLKALASKGFKVFQSDAISLEDGTWVVNEVKHQEEYDPPPFAGHGLPRWQINSRMGFYRLTGIRVRLIIKDKKMVRFIGNGLMFWRVEYSTILLESPQEGFIRLPVFYSGVNYMPIP